MDQLSNQIKLKKSVSRGRIAIIAACSVAVLTAAGLYYQRNYKLPRQYSLKRNSTTLYKKKIPQNLDIIIIGSGIAGLTVAALLSLCGKKVLVLEANDIAGGCTHCSKVNNIEFDTGIHYVGNMDNNNKSEERKIFDLITNNKLKWDKIGTNINDINHHKECYDRIIIGRNLEQKHYFLRAGKQEWINEIKKHFENAQVIEAIHFLNKKVLPSTQSYFKTKVIKYKWLQTVYLTLFNKTNETAFDLVERYTKNKDLQQFLMGLLYDITANPETCPGSILCILNKHFLNGAYYPNGGCSQIAFHIINTIKQNGGTVLCQHKVEKILITRDGRKVKGVEMENGREIYSSIVVSACDIYKTFNNLIKAEIFKPKETVRKINDIGLSAKYLYLFIGLKGTINELKLTSNNIWSFGDGQNALFIAFPCCKDKSWSRRYPLKSNCVIVIQCNDEEFECWKNSKYKKTDKEYQRVLQQMLNNGLYKYYPETRGKVIFSEIRTPLIFNNFMGLKLTKDRFLCNDFLRSECSNIDGLYITGQDITMPGLTASMMSGVITAHRVLDYGGIIDLLSGRNLIKDIQHISNNRIGVSVETQGTTSLFLKQFNASREYEKSLL